jgi:murein DD-endopeptidase MepM/ murein hydrolase activator NlpD
MGGHSLKTAWQKSSAWPRRWLILLLVGLTLVTGPLQSRIAPNFLPFPQPAASKADAGQTAEAKEDEGYKLYEVRPGDSLLCIARSFQVDSQELARINGIKNPELIKAGQELKIPKSGSDKNAAVPVSMLRPELSSRSAEQPVGSLNEGLNWLVPSGNLPAEFQAGPAGWQWPLHGTITLAYGAKDEDGFHHGMDIAGKIGDPILAAAGGKVAFAGVRPVYGRTVVINHGNGTASLYAHASRLLVQVGDQVSGGQEVAEVGNTGNSRGPHLHFEVYRNGKTTNPLGYLPAR